MVSSTLLEGGTTAVCAVLPSPEGVCDCGVSEKLQRVDQIWGGCPFAEEEGDLSAGEDDPVDTSCAKLVERVFGRLRGRASSRPSITLWIATSSLARVSDCARFGRDTRGVERLRVHDRIAEPWNSYPAPTPPLNLRHREVDHAQQFTACHLLDLGLEQMEEVRGDDEEVGQATDLSRRRRNRGSGRSGRSGSPVSVATRGTKR